MNEGLGRRAIQHRVATGLLYREHRGVYSVGRPATTAIERAGAAVLAGGEQALLSHRAALALWGLGGWPRAMEISAAGERRVPGVASHRVTTLARRDVRRHQGIAVTSPARTLLDCAPPLSDRVLTRTVNEALRTKLTTHAQLADLLDRRRIQPGAPRLRAIAGVAVDGLTRSELEDEFLALCAGHGLPRPQTNVHVDGYEVDAYFPDGELIVELDGWSFHNDRRAFERDRERDAVALVAGRRTIRITAARLRAQPDVEAERLSRIIKARGTR